MDKIRFSIWILIVFLTVSCAETGKQKIIILETTDLHGVILPFDFIEKEKINSSLAGVAAYLGQIRKQKDPVILLDNGDNLQGQPEVYYYNFLDTVSPHLNAQAMNYLKYDAGTVGNHDIEAGHSVYDRLIKEYNFPLLAANAVNVSTGKSYFKPYHIIEKKGIKVIVFGLITPAIPDWLPPELYSGIEFRDMTETAKLWMPVLMKEKPDLIVGLFHSGWNRLDENGSASVAYNVPGFDIIFNGHDHKVVNEKIVNILGDTVLILDGGSRSEKAARADITFLSRIKNRKRQMALSGEIINVEEYQPDPVFVSKFSQQQKDIENYVDKIIATSSETISSRDSYFGPSAFVDLIHKIQLEITGADISFAAPLSFDVKIDKGPVTVGDLFKLYRYENLLYTMTMTGNEILKYLEYSYNEWYNTMKGPEDYLLKLRLGVDGKPMLNNEKIWLRNQPYNFDSAAGIDYTVDVSKPEGSRIHIKSFSDGRPFEMNNIYKVAVNSYRGNGGGGHLTEGAGITKEELRTRITASTDRDLRFFIMKFLETKKVINPETLNNWKVIPEQWIKVAAQREYQLLFGRTR
jgi:2',3'-cyclic-nucleotide 2'-phosphodiesterase/3'-nucleotidase